MQQVCIHTTCTRECYHLVTFASRRAGVADKSKNGSSFLEIIYLVPIPSLSVLKSKTVKFQTIHKSTTIMTLQQTTPAYEAIPVSAIGVSDIPFEATRVAVAPITKSRFGISKRVAFSILGVVIVGLGAVGVVSHMQNSKISSLDNDGMFIADSTQMLNMEIPSKSAYAGYEESSGFEQFSGMGELRNLGQDNEIMMENDELY